MIMIDYLEQGHTINGAYYAGELRRPRQLLRHKAGQEGRGEILLEKSFRR